MIKKWVSNIEEQKVLSSRLLLKQKCQLSLNSSENPKQLIVDISIISKNDAGTGIQRVVRGILDELLSNPPEGYIIRTIAGTRTKPYRYIDGKEIAVNAGDIFLGLDLAASATSSNHRQLANWKTQGVTFHFILHDLLPLHHPEWFTNKGVKTFRRWLRSVFILADNVFCFSQFVAKDLLKTCNDCYQINDLTAHIIPMGWNFPNMLYGTGLPENFDHILFEMQKLQTVLMVGTLEPRKGHAQVLEAFEYLWRVEKNYNLVIVGRPGWKTEKLQKKLRNHPERNHHLFWFEDATDEALLKLYSTCNGVIIASLAEGFGLPLIEALLHGKPVLARDLPVFRERHQPGIEYFSANDGQELSSQLAKWLEQIKESTSIIKLPNISSWKDTVYAMLQNFNSSTGNHLTPAK